MFDAGSVLEDARRMSFEAKKPDFILKARLKGTTKSTRRIGSGWANENGSVSIQLDPCTVLHWKDECFITLFPVEESE